MSAGEGAPHSPVSRLGSEGPVPAHEGNRIVPVCGDCLLREPSRTLLPRRPGASSGGGYVLGARQHRGLGGGLGQPSALPPPALCGVQPVRRPLRLWALPSPPWRACVMVSKCVQTARTCAPPAGSRLPAQGWSMVQMLTPAAPSHAHTLCASCPAFPRVQLGVRG